MKQAGAAALAILVMTPRFVLAQTPAEALTSCQRQNESRAAEISQLKAEVERLTQTVVGLSARLTGTTRAEVPTPNPLASSAKLLVVLKTKYGRGQSCRITANGTEVGKIEYPDLSGPDRVMDYSSGFIKLSPGDYRLTVTCTPTRSENIHSIDRDVTLEGGGSFTLQTKINVWTKRLQFEGFGKD